MVLRAFRCQRRGAAPEREILTRICEELYYQGRYVWLRSCREVRLIGTSLTGPNRIRYRLVDTRTLKCLPLNIKENKRVEITSGIALAALPIVKDRRRTLFLFAEPHWLLSHKWDTAVSGMLSPEELAFLIGQDQPPDLATVARALCRFRQLIDRYGVLTKEAKKILVTYINNEEV
jgi:hypothetical protein